MYFLLHQKVNVGSHQKLSTIKVNPYYAVWQGLAAKVVPCCKYMWTLCWLRCGMPFNAAQPKISICKLSVPSKEAAWHMISKGFQNGISQFKKKIRQSSPVSFHSFCSLKKVCKKFFFHVDTIALAACAEQLLPCGKAAVCCILPCGIVWTQLYNVNIFQYSFYAYHTRVIVQILAPLFHLVLY